MYVLLNILEARQRLGLAIELFAGPTASWCLFTARLLVTDVYSGQ